MAFFIYRDPKYDDAIEYLRQKGGKALFAAKKADKIIGKLISGEGRWLHNAGKLTNNGEYRIRYCRKYKLCSGYRLIVIQNENCLILSYVGNHDDCDRWLQRNKGLSYDIVEIEPELLEDKDNSSTNNKIPEDVLEEEICIQEYEQALMKRLNDSSFQKVIFSWFKR